MSRYSHVATRSRPVRWRDRVVGSSTKPLISTAFPPLLGHSLQSTAPLPPLSTLPPNYRRCNAQTTPSHKTSTPSLNPPPLSIPSATPPTPSTHLPVHLAQMSPRKALPTPLLPYLHRPPEAALVLLTATLGGSTTWLTARFAGEVLGPATDGEGSGDQGGVVLASWVRDERFWRGEIRRATVRRFLP